MKTLFAENDILLLTETWLNENHNCNVEGFCHFTLNRHRHNKNAKRDSGGLVIYVANYLQPKVSLLKMKDDRLIWVTIDKSVFNVDTDVFLCLAYTVPTGSAREVFYNCTTFDSIAEDMIEFRNLYNNQCKFLITGDLNARVGKRNDFVANENLQSFDIQLPDDYVTDEKIVRNSQGVTVNDNGCMNFASLRF